MRVTNHLQSTFNFEKFNLEFKEAFPGKSLPSQAFLEWFIGFTEGDGCFYVNRNNNEGAFQVTQSTEDVQVLNYMCDTLGLGIVFKQTEISSDLKIRDLRGMGLIIALFNGNTVLPGKVADLGRFIDSYNMRSRKARVELITTSPIPSLNDHWIAGFIDAEGSFNCSFSEMTNGVSLQFSATQKGHKENLMFSHVASLFGVKTSIQSKPETYQFRACGVKSTVGVVEYFDNHPMYSKKAGAYADWKILRIAIQNKEHLNPDLRPGLKLIAKGLNKKKSRK